MSIDARIIDVCQMDDGTVKLHLHQPDRKRIAGQEYLTVLNPNFGVPKIGTSIWGSANSIMIGDKTIADRIGYDKIKMLENWS